MDLILKLSRDVAWFTRFVHTAGTAVHEPMTDQEETVKTKRSWEKEERE